MCIDWIKSFNVCKPNWSFSYIMRALYDCTVTVTVLVAMCIVKDDQKNGNIYADLIKLLYSSVNEGT